MGQGVLFAGAGVGIALAVCTAAIALVSLREGERRAALVFTAIALIVGLPLALAPIAPRGPASVVVVTATVIAVAILIRCLLPPRRPREPGGRPGPRLLQGSAGAALALIGGVV